MVREITKNKNVKTIILTYVNYRAKSVPPNELALYCPTDMRVLLTDSCGEALYTAKRESEIYNNPVIVCCGSLYLVGDMKLYLANTDVAD
jgi:folylpolyglutamate synthase/dihydropteroate synthase